MRQDCCGDNEGVDLVGGSVIFPVLYYEHTHYTEHYIMEYIMILLYFFYYLVL